MSFAHRFVNETQAAFDFLAIYFDDQLAEQLVKIEINGVLLGFADFDSELHKETPRGQPSSIVATVKQAGHGGDFSRTPRPLAAAGATALIQDMHRTAFLNERLAGSHPRAIPGQKPRGAPGIADGISHAMGLAANEFPADEQANHEEKIDAPDEFAMCAGVITPRVWLESIAGNGRSFDSVA
jgi:hypothetical protein